MCVLCFRDALSHTCLQTQALVDWLALSSKTPTVLCGDFNALPTGPIYRLLTHGSLSPEENRMCDPDTYGYILPYRRFKLPAGSAWRSAYATEPAATYRPHATELQVCQDYVFFQLGALAVAETLTVPPLAGSLPDAARPSSHLPVGASFVFL
jgi:endonuclease/exonuclease/phosphatase family metal-dependent hydrolase